MQKHRKAKIGEEDMQNDMVFDKVVTPKQREDKKLNGVVIVETLNDTDDEEMEEDKRRSAQATQTTKNEDKIIFLSESGPSVITFKPLNRTSQEEVGPLLRVDLTSFKTSHLSTQAQR